MTPDVSRRSFIRLASLAAAGSTVALQSFGNLSALAQSTGDYKALVCVFLYGGNDGNNMIVPFTSGGYANYLQGRGPLAIAQANLLQLGRAPGFALHPSMPEMCSLFDSANMAIVANVGTLVQPLTRASYIGGSGSPAALFSHPDQQTAWQVANPQGSSADGWGGRVSDALSSGNTGQVPMSISVAGNAVFGNGAETSQLCVTPGNLGDSWCNEGRGECAEMRSVAQSILTLNSGVSLVQAEAQIAQQSGVYAQNLQSAVSSLPTLHTVFPANPLAVQLQQIAQLIQARAALGGGRQIFFASLGSFDTHSSQLSLQSTLLQQLSSSLAAFYQATQEMGVAANVTTFTMSDFARTFEPNSNTGSDHAWGSHHMVLGGAVKCGSLYGTFPTLVTGGPDDSDTTGRWIPTTATVQYASTLAQWFGVSGAALSGVFPTLGNFPTSDLGFV